MIFIVILWDGFNYMKTKKLRYENISIFLDTAVALLEETIGEGKTT